MISNNDSLMDTIKKNLYEILIDIKNCLSKFDQDKLQNDFDKEINSSSDVIALINKLKSYINFIVKENYSKENNVNYNDKDSQKEIIRQLESYIKKLESDIKYNIARQYREKISKNSLESKLRAYMQIEEDYEDLKEKVRFEEGRFMENDRKDNEIIILRRENSNLKQEIFKLNKKYKKMNELVEKNKQLEKKLFNDEEYIRNLNLKINQLNSKIAEMEQEIKDNKKTKISNEENLKNDINSEIYINDNNFNYVDLKPTKISLNKFSLKSTGNNSQRSENNIQQTFSIFNNDFKYNKSRTTKTMNNFKNFVEPNIYNQIYKTNDPITQLRNKIYKNIKNKKINSISMKVDEKEISDSLAIYLQNNKKNNFEKHAKSRSLKKIEQNFSGYRFNISNNSVRKKYSKEVKNNKNIIYEHSALNILGIHRKYKI